MDSGACPTTAQALVTEETWPSALKPATRFATQFTVAFHHIWRRALVVDTAAASKAPSSGGNPSACGSVVPSAGRGERRTQSRTICSIVSLESLQLRQMAAWACGAGSKRRRYVSVRRAPARASNSSTLPMLLSYSFSLAACSLCSRYICRVDLHIMSECHRAFSTSRTCVRIEWGVRPSDVSPLASPKNSYFPRKR